MKRAMAKPKTHYYCAECGADSRKWAGQCAECGAWNTLIEQVVQPGQVDPSTPAMRVPRMTLQEAEETPPK